MKYSKLTPGDFFILNKSKTCVCLKLNSGYIMFPDEVISDDPADSDPFLESIKVVKPEDVTKTIDMSAIEMRLKASNYE